MKKGVLIFAFNNNVIDYVKLAAWSAARINRHLDLPVTLVTDTPLTDKNGFEQVICVSPGEPGNRWFDDYGQTVPWYNSTRVESYDLSPYDLTIVLDSDYIVSSSDLTRIMDTCYSFLAPRYAYDVTNTSDMRDLNWFGMHNMPSAWATIMMFRRDKDTEAAFDMMKMARDNWQHYRQLHGIAQPNYRNDYALAMGLNVVMGRAGTWPSIPWAMASVDPRHNIKQVDEDEFQIDYMTPAGQFKYITIRNHDFHAMGKRALGDLIGNHS
jgi:hypothetical protein